jgi:hypothetical protein
MAFRPLLHFGTIKSDNLTVVLATIREVRVTSPPRLLNSKREHPPTFSFRLNIAEVIRPGNLADGVRQVSIARSVSGYATNWEFDAQPENGMKVLAHLKKTAAGEWELYPFPGGVVILKDFDDDHVRLTRKVVKFLEIARADEQLTQLLAGCRDQEPQFQAYCIHTLWRSDDLGTGTDLSAVLTPEIALSHIWEVYTAPTGTSFEAVQTCESVFGNTFRGAGWESYLPRYPILRQVLHQRREIHHNLLDHMVMAVCRYPEHARENYELLLEILDGPIEIYKFGAAQRFSLIYQPHTTDAQMQKLNSEILRRLAENLTHKNNSIADGAAIAIGYIAESYAKTGPVPEYIARLLNRVTDVQVAGNVRARLEHGQREAQSVKRPRLPADVQPLSFPWENLLGKKIFASARTVFRDGEHGTSVEVSGRRLWIEGLDAWPNAIRGGSEILITGTLTKRDDLKAFRYEPGKPFGMGLPVPENYSLESARQRYVLIDASWQPRD